MPAVRPQYPGTSITSPLLPPPSVSLSGLMMHSTGMPDRFNMAARLKNLLLLRREEVFISSWPIHRLFPGHSDDLCSLSHFSEMTLMLPGFGKLYFCAHRFLTTALMTVVPSKVGTRMRGLSGTTLQVFHNQHGPSIRE